MGRFILGVIVTLARTHPRRTRLRHARLFAHGRQRRASALERRIAMGAVDASMERHAPHVTNPLTPTDQNLEDGMKLYTMNCALCHGGLDRKPSTLAFSFYPPAPNFISDPPDDHPEWHIFYTVRNGIRYTGMPAWDKTLTDQDIWKITMLLSHLDKLPPAVQDYWKTSFGVEPGTSEEKKEGEEKHEHH